MLMLIGGGATSGATHGLANTLAAGWTATTTVVILGAQLLFLAIAAFVASRQVSEAKQLREAQAQPFVVVDFEIERRSEINIVISNIGGTMARDIRLTFTPDLTSSFDRHPNVVAPRELKPFREGIASLPPGKRIVVLFDLFTERDEEKFPDEYQVAISFDAPALGKHLTDESTLDLGVYRNVLVAGRQDIHDVHARLKEVVKELKKWTSSGSGINIVTEADRQAEGEALAERLQRQKEGDS